MVQGVGFRPFVYTTAREHGLSGFVGNDVDGVFIEAQGSDLDAFVNDLRAKAPPLAEVHDVTVTAIACQDETGFAIVTSLDGQGATSIPPDTAVCDDCLVELFDPANRRYGYPFIACTNCGPRYTMTISLPYDREHTTMREFPLCEACTAEYEDPTSRRFHAQPTACAECGPRLSMSIPEIVEALQAGQIVAMKGIGGYHLVCDARNEPTVARLRERKQRGSKPFAVMVPELDDVVANSPARPIVIIPAFDAALNDAVAPGNNFIGVMVPYSPVHHLLFANGAPRVLVMTSGNLADEPICITETEAEDRLAGIADVFLHHNRRIQLACDDSVTRVIGDVAQPVRRSRGYAPLPIRLPMQVAPTVAVGGELKTTACVARDELAWMSQHIGDTENLETLAMLERTVHTLSELQRVTPERIVSDAHPGYLSRRWAEQFANEHDIQHVTVQHHHAHFAALLAEHGWGDEPVLGVTFDGTGFGTDGTIWGGEFLLGGYAHVDRVGHLSPISLPGGDAATRRPARTAYAHVVAAGLRPAGLHVDEHEQQVLAQLLRTGTSCTPTTSMGRLFDAISSLLDVCHDAEYEGQAAIELEALATKPSPGAIWEQRWIDDQLVLDPAAAIAAAIAGRSDTRAAAYAFHDSLASAVTQAAVAIRGRTGVKTVGLTGGVFSNALLTTLTRAKLSDAGLSVLTHRVVPPNDGGLALGQIAVAARAEFENGA